MEGTSIHAVVEKGCVSAISRFAVPAAFSAALVGCPHSGVAIRVCKGRGEGRQHYHRMEVRSRASLSLVQVDI